MAGFIACLIFPVPAAANLVRNSGFEASSANATGMEHTGPVPAMQPEPVSTAVFITSGKYGLKMESKNPNCYGGLFNTWKSPGDRPTCSQPLRAENVKSIDKSVLIRIKWFKDKEQLGYNYIYNITDKPNGWFLASDKILAIPGATTAEISLEFSWSTGTVWWDDISLEASTENRPEM